MFSCLFYPPLSVEANKEGSYLQKTAIPSEQPTVDVNSSALDPESINSADPLFAMEAKQKLQRTNTKCW